MNSLPDTEQVKAPPVTLIKEGEIYRVTAISEDATTYVREFTVGSPAHDFDKAGHVYPIFEQITLPIIERKIFLGVSHKHERAHEHAYFLARKFAVNMDTRNIGINDLVLKTKIR